MPVTRPLWSRVIDVEPALQTPGCCPEEHRGKRDGHCTDVRPLVPRALCPGYTPAPVPCLLRGTESSRAGIRAKGQKSGEGDLLRAGKRRQRQHCQRDALAMGPRAERGVGIGSGPTPSCFLLGVLLVAHCRGPVPARKVGPVFLVQSRRVQGVRLKTSGVNLMLYRYFTFLCLFLKYSKVHG